MQGVVKKRIRNNDGETFGVVDRNTLLDTSKDEVQCLSGFVEYVTPNNIA